MQSANNPATRLATIMGGLRGQRANQPINESLRAVLGCAEGPPFYRAYGLLLELPPAIDTAVRDQFSSDQSAIDDYLSWQGAIGNALHNTLDLQVRTSTVLGCYSDEDVLKLRMCGRAIGLTADTDETVGEAALETLRQRVHDLHNDVVADAGLPADLKRFLVEKLNLIRDALVEVKLRGPRAISDVLESITGALIQQRGLFEDDGEASQSAMQKFGEVVDLTEKTVNLAVKVGGYLLAGAIGLQALTSAQAALPEVPSSVSVQVGEVVT